MKKAMAWLLVLALVAAVIPFAAPTEVAAAYSSAQVAALKPTIISNSTYANYVTKMIQYHVGSSTDNYRVYRNLSAGKSAVFLFEGCSDNADHGTYGNYNNYRLSAYCAVVKEVNGSPAIVYENENCSTLPDNPRKTSLNGGTAVPTVKDGIYNINSTNHLGRYAALNVVDNSGSAPVVRCTGSTSYSSTSTAINVHARSNFSGAPTNGICSTSYSSTGCFIIGRTNNTWSEYNNFVYAVQGISNAIRTTPYSSGSWTKCSTGIDRGVLVVDRYHYQDELKAIYGGDNSNSAASLVSTMTAYTNNLLPSVPEASTGPKLPSSILNKGNAFTAYITNAKSGKNLDVDLNNSGNVVVNSDNGKSSQLWRFTRQSDGSYEIRSLKTGRLLDVEGASTGSGANVTTTTDTNQASQRWFLYSVDGAVVLRSACTQCVLDVTGGGNSPDGTNVESFKYIQSDAQLFYLYSRADKFASRTVMVGKTFTQAGEAWKDQIVALHPKNWDSPNLHADIPAGSKLVIKYDATAMKTAEFGYVFYLDAHPNKSTQEAIWASNRITAMLTNGGANITRIIKTGNEYETVVGNQKGRDFTDKAAITLRSGTSGWVIVDMPGSYEMKDLAWFFLRLEMSRLNATEMSKNLSIQVGYLPAGVEIPSFAHGLDEFEAAVNVEGNSYTAVADNYTDRLVALHPKNWDSPNLHANIPSGAKLVFHYDATALASSEYGFSFYLDALPNRATQAEIWKCDRLDMTSANIANVTRIIKKGYNYETVVGYQKGRDLSGDAITLRSGTSGWVIVDLPGSYEMKDLAWFFLRIEKYGMSSSELSKSLMIDRAGYITAGTAIPNYGTTWVAPSTPSTSTSKTTTKSTTQSTSKSTVKPSNGSSGNTTPSNTTTGSVIGTVTTTASNGTTATQGNTTQGTHHTGADVTKPGVTTTTTRKPTVTPNTDPTWRPQTSTTNPAGHRYDSYQFVDEHTHKGVCADCGKEMSEAHLWDGGTQQVAPSCGVNGTKAYLCQICGAAKVEDIPATGAHNYGEWIVVREAEDTVAGSKQRICQDCGSTEVEVIPALNAPTAQDDTLVWWIVGGCVAALAIAGGVIWLILWKKKKQNKN